MNKKLLEAYLICLGLAKENAFKCMVWIETNKSNDSFFFSVVVKGFDAEMVDESFVHFYDFLPTEIDENVEKVKQLINESI